MDILVDYMRPFQSKSPKITFGSANASILAPSPNPNPSLNQAQWPPRPPLQPKAESSLPTETYLDKVRIAEALIARDVAVEKLEAVCASVRDKQLKIDNLERERDRLKEELNGITSSVPAIGHHEEGKEGNVWAKQREKFLDEINTLEQSNQTLKNENENLRKTCLFDQDDALGERAHSKVSDGKVHHCNTLRLRLKLMNHFRISPSLKRTPINQWISKAPSPELAVHSSL